MSDDTDYLLRRLRVARATVPQDGPTDRVLAQAHDEIERLREAARLALTVHDLIDHWSECPAPPDAGCGECHNYYAAVAALRASLSEAGGEGA